MFLRLIAPYRKAVLYAVGAAILAFQSYNSDEIYTPAEIMQTFLAGLGLFLVYMLPDAPGAKFVKIGVGVVIAALQLLIGALENGEPLDRSVWINVLIAALSVLGLIPKNEPEPAIPPTAELPASPSSFNH